MFEQIFYRLLRQKIQQKLSFILKDGFLLLYSIMLLGACMTDEEYTSSIDDRLTFSADTVRFDTVFSGQPTATTTFEVYNKSDKAIRIKDIHLEGLETSVFRVNVDGVFLENGRLSDQEMEIAAKDSMRVFVMANIAVQGSGDVRDWCDKLVFQTEAGAENVVFLNVSSQDARRFGSLIVDRDTTFTDELPYIIKDSLVVSKNATLKLSAGCKFYFGAGARLVVHGTLLAEGTLENKILMRGERTDYMFANQPYDRVPGQWGGIVFTAESHGNKINYCDIHSGECGLRCDSSYNDEEKLRMENTILHNMSEDGLRVKSSKVFVGNSQITNCGGNCVTLLGGNSTFVHCTIANFYVFTGGRGKALYYTNYYGNERLPLEEATFLNCIITGYSDDEIEGNASTENKDDAFHYLFQNCLLDTPAVEGEGIVNCYWDNNKDQHEVWREGNFAPEFDLSRLIFSFALDEKSQAIGHADLSISRQYYPFDMNGRDRLLDESSDIGCYEYQESKKVE